MRTSRALRRSTRDRGSRRKERWPLIVFAGAAIGLSAVRRRLGVHPPLTLPIVSSAPIALAAGVPSGRARKLAVGASCLWLFKVSWEAHPTTPGRA